MTNMSSAPIPSIRIGSASATSDVLKSKRMQNPEPAETESIRQVIPTNVAANLQWIGLKEPRNKIK